MSLDFSGRLGSLPYLTWHLASQGFLSMEATERVLGLERLKLELASDELAWRGAGAVADEGPDPL